MKPTLCALTGHRDQLTAAHYLGNGQRVTTASRDGSARVWEAGTCRELAAAQESSGYFYGLSPSQAGDRIVAWSNSGTATVFDSETLQRQLQLKADGKILSAVFGPHDDRILTTSSDGNARVWEAASGRLENQFWSSEGPLTTGQFSPSGDTFATVDAYLFTVTNWGNMLKVDMSAFPNVLAYQARVGARPAVQAALVAEGLVKAA